MIRKTTFLLVALVALAGSPALAQVEISGTAGWTWSDGVSGTAEDVPDVGVFNRIDPTDAFSWGLRVGFMMGENNELGFLFNQQSTDLELNGTATVKLADLSIRNYHGYWAYNFGDGDAAARPYFLLGFGGTQYGSITGALGGMQSISGNTRFSGTAALGLKVFPSPRFGLRLEGRWTPTYIKSDAAGWWCDPYWGCYVVGNAQYANQFEVSGGLIFRF